MVDLSIVFCMFTRPGKTSSNSASALFGSASQFFKVATRSGLHSRPFKVWGKAKHPRVSQAGHRQTRFSICGGVMRCPKSWGYPKSSKFWPWLEVLKPMFLGIPYFRKTRFLQSHQMSSDMLSECWIVWILNLRSCWKWRLGLSVLIQLQTQSWNQSLSSLWGCPEGQASGGTMSFVDTESSWDTSSLTSQSFPIRLLGGKKIGAPLHRSFRKVEGPDFL